MAASLSLNLMVAAHFDVTARYRYIGKNERLRIRQPDHQAGQSRSRFCLRGEMNPANPRSIGSLFYACCDEMKDLTLFEALHRLLTLALEKVKVLQ